MRGPATMPRSTAIFKPAGAPAASRTVVTPASSVCRMRGMACNKRSDGWVINTRNISGYSTRKWTWQSIRPGKMLSPIASITVASRGMCTWSWRSIAVIRSPSINIVIPVNGSPPRPSIILPFMIASVIVFSPIHFLIGRLSPAFRKIIASIARKRNLEL